MDNVPVGERLFGYFPTASHLKIVPEKISDTHLSDGAPHRVEMAKVYDAYTRVRAEPGYDPDMEDECMLLFPLYVTSYYLYGIRPVRPRF